MTAGSRFAFWALVFFLLVGARAAQPGGRDTSHDEAAYLVRSLHDPAHRDEMRPDVLDTPVLPGSVMKALSLVAAIESQVIEPDSRRMCRRVVTVNGRRYVCTHPDLKRPMAPAEALAHSCNDYFVALAPRLPRAALNDLRVRLGLPPIAAGVDLAAALVGLDGPRITPRALLDVIARLAGADPNRPVLVSEVARRTLLDGFRGAAQYGSARSLGDRRLVTLAKTGTAPMPGGRWMGLLVALEPADKPTRGVVVVAPGAAGLDAAAIAADLLAPAQRATPAPPRSAAPAVRPGPESIRIGLTANGSTRVTRFELEDYVARVVAAEGEAGAADAAQQALAIAARTFALANLQRHRRENYDLCDTTHCQVLRPATAASRRAAQATAGRVLVHDDQPATIFYSASCGGYSELASEVWPGAVDYGAVSQRDEACRNEPRWTSDIRVGDIERALRVAGHRGARLRNLRVVQRNASNRVARLRVEGFSPPEISGHDLRMAIGRVAGWQQMKSTAFDVRRTGIGYRFTGRGFGHGVGLCVIGAGQRALAGSNANQILKFYFPRLRIETVGAVPALTANRTPIPTAAPAGPAAADPRPDVVIALAAGEEPERAQVVQLIRLARDRIAAKAGVAPPLSIRVTVHPTVESFARATGQPWWVSGATEGSNIDLLPIAMLRQRSQLERTIRHEVAHVLLDPVLSARPLWVREGAAQYFAGQEAVAASVGRGACPADFEFLRPLSAGAHRSAYSRAETCFRRALSEGKSWRDVK